MHQQLYLKIKNKFEKPPRNHAETVYTWEVNYTNKLSKLGSWGSQVYLK